MDYDFIARMYVFINVHKVSDLYFIESHTGYCDSVMYVNNAVFFILQIQFTLFN